MSLVGGIVYSAPAPDGYVPDFNRPYDATALIASIGVFLPLAVITSAIRIYTRSRIVSDLAIDDFLNYGLGKHLYDVPLNMLYPNFLFSNILAAIFFCAATGFAKASILLFYSRIFPSRAFKFITLSLVVFTVSYSLASVLVNVFSCKPVRGSWELSLATSAVCINRPVFYFAQAGLGIFTDFATLAAPLPFLWKLQMPVRQKIGVSAVLMMGGFVCIVSIIRLLSIKTLLDSADLTKATTPALMWCVIELNISIIGGNFPTLRPFLRKYVPALLGSSKGRTSATGKTRSGSHQLLSFDPTYTSTARKGFNKTTIAGMDQKTHLGDNESEEYIIQRGAHDSETDLGRSGQVGAGPLNHPKNGFGNITKTVEYSLTNSKE
ncbi:hypothetical protein BKA64DRAFT_581538 [Cadophora sp. MPI-SDFR-AT-0126]|nr:hypothetical protein BKA64DRAFT_581538 [Leotiomycetes sp. MPI-SDFR-AT-0126]